MYKWDPAPLCPSFRVPGPAKEAWEKADSSDAVEAHAPCDSWA